MSLFICENCGCVDNTSMNNNFWTRKSDIWNGHRALCQECTPRTYSDGTKVYDDCWGRTGKWHNKFPKKHWSEYGTKKEILKDKGFVGAKEYFENHKE